MWNRTVDFEALKRHILQDPTCFDSHELVAVGRIADLNPLYLNIWHNIAIPRAREQFCLVAEQGIRNFMTSLTIRGYYDETALPPWMTDDIRSVIRDKMDRVSFQFGPIGQPHSKEGPFDLISPSNIFDWMDTPSAIAVFESLGTQLQAPDGYILLRIAFPEAHSVRLVQETVSSRDFKFVTK